MLLNTIRYINNLICLKYMHIYVYIMDAFQRFAHTQDSTLYKIQLYWSLLEPLSDFLQLFFRRTFEGVKHAYTDSKRHSSSCNIGVAGTNSGNNSNCPYSKRVLMIRINPFVIRVYVHPPFRYLRYVRFTILRHISPVQCILSFSLGFQPFELYIVSVLQMLRQYKVRIIFYNYSCV